MILWPALDNCFVYILEVVCNFYKSGSKAKIKFKSVSPPGKNIRLAWLHHYFLSPLVKKIFHLFFIFLTKCSSFVNF